MNIISLEIFVGREEEEPFSGQHTGDSSVNVESSKDYAIRNLALGERYEALLDVSPALWPCSYS